MGYMDFLIGHDITSLALALISLACLYPLLLWTYNLTLHPLASFPGPLHWRASRIPYMRAVWHGRFPYDVQHLHAQYGDVVRTAPNELSFASPSSWDDIYSNRGANARAFPKSDLWHGNPGGGPATIFVTTDLKEHARLRRFMDPAFSSRAVLEQEPILQKYVDLCVAQLRKRVEKGKVNVNVVDWINFTIFDSLGDLCFGESFGCLQKCEYEGWMAHMAAAIQVHYFAINLRHYPLVTMLLKPLIGFLIPRGLVEQQQDYQARATAKLKRRLASEVGEVKRADIVSQLIRSEDRKEGLTEGEVVVNTMLFINAASESTATTLTAVFWNLLRYPACLAVLEEEVRGFADASDLTLSALRRLPYLNAVLKETLRMCNPNPIGHMRTTPPHGGTVSGHPIPGNTLLTIQPLTLSLSPTHFHDAHTFRPERWLPDAEANPTSPFYHDQRKAVRAFGWGPQNCVGEALGWAWMRLIVAKIVFAFGVESGEEGNGVLKGRWEDQEVYAIVHKSPLRVVLREMEG